MVVGDKVRMDQRSPYLYQNRGMEVGTIIEVAEDRDNHPYRVEWESPDGERVATNVYGFNDLIPERKTKFHGSRLIFNFTP